MTVEVRQVDKKGRVVLGSSFANKLVQIEQVTECEFRIVFVQTVPENEMWLYQNEEAKSSVFRGLEQARNRKFVDGPDLASDAAQVEEFAGDMESESD